jgi:hypothetical protein
VGPGARVAEDWSPAWGAETDACLSAPLVVAAGTSRDLAATITGPQGAALGDGTYRAVVYGLHAAPVGQDRVELPAARRTSAPFHYPATVAPD